MDSGYTVIVSVTASSPVFYEELNLSHKLDLLRGMRILKFKVSSL